MVGLWARGCGEYQGRLWKHDSSFPTEIVRISSLIQCEFLDYDLLLVLVGFQNTAPGPFHCMTTPGSGNGPIFMSFSYSPTALPFDVINMERLK